MRSTGHRPTRQCRSFSAQYNHTRTPQRPGYDTCVSSVLRSPRRTQERGLPLHRAAARNDYYTIVTTAARGRHLGAEWETDGSFSLHTIRHQSNGPCYRCGCSNSLLAGRRVAGSRFPETGTRGLPGRLAWCHLCSESPGCCPREESAKAWDSEQAHIMAPVVWKHRQNSHPLA